MTLSWPMRPIFLAGCALMLLAVAAAAAETAARAAPGVHGAILSAYDVLYALWPSKLIVAKIHIETGVGRWAWDPLARGLLALPGWLLLGAPGAALAWVGRQRGEQERDGDGDGDDFAAAEDSVFLYDSLARRARAEGYAGDDEPRFEPVYATPEDIGEPGEFAGDGPAPLSSRRS